MQSSVIKNFTRSLFTRFSAFALCAATTFAQGASADLADQRSIENGTPNLLRAGVPASVEGTNASAPIAMRSREVVRSRPVTLNFSVLQKVGADIATGKPQTIRIALFDDAALEVQITRTEHFGRNGTAYIGTVPGVTFSSAVIVEENGVVSGNIDTRHHKYQIRNVGDAGHVVQQIDATAFGPDHAMLPVAPHPAGVRALPASTKVLPPPEASIQTADSGALIDVMVVYTPSARISEGGTAGMQSRINLIVAETNNAYANSQVTQRIRLVYAGEVNYAETDLSTDLGRLQNPSDGFIDEVHALRNLYGADLVSLWGNYAVGCGQSNIMLTEGATFEGQAFNVVDRNCAAGNYSFAHELGHNMGLLHDVADAPGGTVVTPEGSTVSTSIAYAHGYVDSVNLFRTVMAVTTACANCVRIPYFSNPNVSFNAAPTGNTNAQGFQALNDTRDTTANFRMSVNLTGAGTVVFSPATYTVNENAGSITLSATRHAGSTGAVSVHYATANGSATAGVDYTATSGVLNWADGESGAKTFSVPILQTAAVSSPTFTVTLDMPSGGVSIVAPGLSATATVTINDFPQTGPAIIQSAPPPGGLLNIPYSYKVVASGAPTIAYSNEPVFTLPPGLTLNTSTGIISGIPNTLGTFGGSIRASNSMPPYDPQQFLIAITALPPSSPIINTVIAGDGQASITFTPSASQGSGPISNYTVACNPGAHTATGLTSPIDVTGLTNGTEYACRVTADNTYGIASSGTLFVTPMLNAVPALVAVKSRKLHAAAGPQLLLIDINALITGNVSVEPRGSGSAGHTMVFYFNAAITSVGPVTAKDANGLTVGTVSATRVGNTVEVTLLGVPDNKRLTISLTGVNAGATVFAVSLGFLVGDVNNTGSVNASDISGLKARLGQATTSANFRFDVNASGVIDASDISAVKARSGLVLP